MRLEFNFGSISRKGAPPKPGAPFRLALLGDFSGRGNRGEVGSAEDIARRKPLKVDVDNLDTLIGGWDINLKLPIGPDGGVVEIPIADMDGLHPDELYQNVSLFTSLAALRQKLKNPATFKAAAKEVQGWKPVKVAKPRKVRPDPNAKHTTHRAQLLLALTDSPQDYRDLARETGLMPHTVKLCMSNLVYKGLARNVGKLGQRGLYTLPAFAMPTEAEGWCDV